MLYDLKGHNVDFFSEESAGNKLIAHIVYSKLPLSFKKELKNVVKSNYPSIENIFDNYTLVLRTLEKLRPVNIPKVSQSKGHSPSIALLRRLILNIKIKIKLKPKGLCRPL